MPARRLRIHPHGADALEPVYVAIHRTTIAGTVQSISTILTATRCAIGTPGAVCRTAVAHACIAGAVAVALTMRSTTLFAALQTCDSKRVVCHRGQLPRYGSREVRRRDNRDFWRVGSGKKRQRKQSERCSKS